MHHIPPANGIPVIENSLLLSRAMNPVLGRESSPSGRYFWKTGRANGHGLRRRQQLTQEIPSSDRFRQDTHVFVLETVYPRGTECGFLSKRRDADRFAIVIATLLVSQCVRPFQGRVRHTPSFPRVRRCATTLGCVVERLRRWRKEFKVPSSRPYSPIGFNNTCRKSITTGPGFVFGLTTNFCRPADKVTSPIVFG